jgi:hypothetical protein
MGLDVSHNCWSGAYSAFHRWRDAVATAAGFGSIDLYQGFGGELEWPEDPLVVLLHHSDCDGDIAPEDCAPLADALERLIPMLDEMGDGGGHVGYYGKAARRFVAGLRAAAEVGEPVEFS